VPGFPELVRPWEALPTRYAPLHGTYVLSLHCSDVSAQPRAGTQAFEPPAPSVAALCGEGAKRDAKG
jgi:hypothetical protein